MRPGNGLDSCPWGLLKQRLEAVCPTDPAASKLGRPGPAKDTLRQHFIFQARARGGGARRLPRVALTRLPAQVEVTDRVGLLHDVTQALWERELTGAACWSGARAGATRRLLTPSRLFVQCTARTCRRAPATTRWTCFTSQARAALPRAPGASAHADVRPPARVAVC